MSELLNNAIATVNRPEMAGKMNRKGFIGGSDIASIFGVSSWKTAYELWEEKTTGWVEESTEARDKVLNRGKKLEPLVIEMLQEERDVWVLERNQTHIDTEHPFLRCEIDFEYVANPDANKEDFRANIGNGDVKTVHPFAAKDWGEEGTDEFPIYYCLQFMHGLMVTGRQVCMVAALIGADDLRVYEVKRDEELIAEIRKRAVSSGMTTSPIGFHRRYRRLMTLRRCCRAFRGSWWRPMR